MTSAAIAQEIELFSQAVAILDNAVNKDEQKRKQALLRLKSKVSVEQATLAFEDATRRGSEDERRDAEKALGALLDFMPSEDAINLLKQGLQHPDPATRASSIAKLSQIRDLSDDVVQSILARFMDEDTKVALAASKFFTSRVGRKHYLSTINDAFDSILMGKMKGSKFVTDRHTFAPRIWESCSELIQLTNDEEIAQFCEKVLLTMFEDLFKLSDDILFVLNVLEILATLPRNLTSRLGGEKLIAILLRYATDQEMVADDCLRVLCALHIDGGIGTRDQFLDIVEKRMADPNLSLGSLEIFATYFGANNSCFSYCVRSRQKLSERWLYLVMKLGHGGNDLPRNVALDAIAKSLRGGSLLLFPLNPSSVTFKTFDAPEYKDSEQFSKLAFDFFKSSLPSILAYVKASIQSLHVPVQMAGYSAIRVLVSQNGKWGISKVFEHIPKLILLNPQLPSPNTTVQVVEWRYQTIAACATQFLSPQEDGELLVDLARFIQAGVHPSAAAIEPKVDVATMRA